MVSFWTEPFLTFKIFLKKTFVKKKKFTKIVLNYNKKAKHILKCSRKKVFSHFKAILAVLGHSKTKIFSVGQHGKTQFFEALAVLLKYIFVWSQHPLKVQMLQEFQYILQFYACIEYETPTTSIDF